jgi:dihydroorotate dehydrogenase
MLYKFLKSIFFLFEAENIHKKVFKLTKFFLGLPLANSITKKIFIVNNPKLEKEVFGLRFPNPVGLAAGFDKDAKLFNELACFGFGFIEIGTLTPKPQPGNDKPRLFRLPEDEAIINRMGFNNQGVEVAVQRLKNKKQNIIIGGNIGKNKVTPNEEAVKDYEFCFRVLYDYVDYFVVNVSSPNTPNLRDLQEKEPLTKLLLRLKELNRELAAKTSVKLREKGEGRPILLKIAPDLTNSQLDDIIDIVKTSSIDGVIATNTTINRDGLKTSKTTIENIGAGGLSGKPLKNRSTEVIKYLSEKSGKAFPIIGVGGIHSPEDAIEKINAGADLIQLYTGFIYEGPSLVKRINNKLIKQ